MKHKDAAVRYRADHPEVSLEEARQATKRRPDPQPIEALYLTTRVRNALRQVGIHTTQDLREMAGHLVDVRDLGAIGIREIHDKFSAYDTRPEA